MPGENGHLDLPGVRAHMGDWIYYLCFMKMRDIADRISFAKEIHSSESLKELLQRQLTDRAVDIANYLTAQRQRFFNALVVGTYGGDPQWNELAVNTTRPMPEYIEGALGILTLEGSEKLFAIDGQHRVAGIREAVRRDAAVGSDEVGVIFVSGVTAENRTRDPQGFERTRRLFTTLNRYAKPVSKKDIIALDEDDVVAIVTRQLVEEHALFRDKISLAQARSLPVFDRKSFTTIIVLYDVLDGYLGIGRLRWRDFKRVRPSEGDVATFYAKAAKLWEVIAERFAPVRELWNSRPDDEIASRYRNDQGGHLLFRPIGLRIFTEAMIAFMNGGLPLEGAVDRLALAPMGLAGSPWVGVLWDPINRRMLTSPENRVVATKSLFYSVGGSLEAFKTTEEDLKRELAGLLHREPEEVQLPRFV